MSRGLSEKIRRDVLGSKRPKAGFDPDAPVDHVYENLKQIYKATFKPVEEHYRFADFFSHVLSDSDIEAKPFVLLLGQYSVGKTTFINNLLGQDKPQGYPGANVGPEPTTDRFVAIMQGGAHDRILPGNAVSASQDKPFKGLQAFGNAFLQKFVCAETQAEVLKSMTLIDTPGVLSGEKQRIGRNYDMSEVCKWFAERSDLILILFDAHKLDISDELKEVMANLRGHDDKIRIVLNKSDQVTPKQLMRVYGALMWNLGKVLRTPEVTRIYISSFWHKPYAEPGAVNKELFDSEKSDLFSDLGNIPRNAALRRVNEIVKRARLLKAHALVCATLKKMMPAMFGKDKKQRELLDNLDVVFHAVAQEHSLSQGDFPEVEGYRKKLRNWTAAGQSLSSLPSMNKDLITKLDKALNNDVPLLIKPLAAEPIAPARLPYMYDDEFGSPKSKGVEEHEHSAATRSGSASGNAAQASGSGTADNKRVRVRALCEFKKSASDEISFSAGDLIEILEEDSSGWWKGQSERSGCSGWFPANYVEKV